MVTKTASEHLAKIAEQRAWRARQDEEDMQERIARSQALTRLLARMDATLDNSHLSGAEFIELIREARDEYDRTIREICEKPRSA